MSETTNKPNSYRYFVELSFDGGVFNGWQIQPNAPSVQGELNRVFSMFFRSQVLVTGAGRTDTGVHATQMFAHFDLTEPIDALEDVIYKLNRFLGSEIAIADMFPVDPEAHARFSAIERGYTYRISQIKNPFTVNRAWGYYRELNVDLMNQAAQMLLNHRDFACFCKSDTDVKTTLCDVREANWQRIEGELVFTIKADRFLRNMVRAIVGTLVEVGEGKHSLSDFQEILDSKSRSSAGTSAPAHGLYLSSVSYSNDIRIKE